MSSTTHGVENANGSVESLLDDADERTIKRAQWEAFEFEVSAGVVTVRNASYADPSDHEYRVVVEDGIPVACDCTGFQYDSTEKHLVAVAIREPVLQAAQAGEMAVATDGGAVTTHGREDDHCRPDDCDCHDWNSDTIELPCWPCYRDGFDTVNSEVSDDE